MTAPRRVSRAVALILAPIAQGCDSPSDPAAAIATAITLSPTSIAFSSLGDTLRLQATVRDQRGRAMPGALTTWASSDSSVAHVSGSGLVTALANGSATVTAASGAARGSAAVSIAQVAATLTVSPTELVLRALGDTATLTPTVFDARGQMVPGAAVAWTSAAPGIATVSTAGLVTAVADGAVQITATSGSATDTARVIVTTPQTCQSPSVKVIEGTAPPTLTAAGGPYLLRGDTVRAMQLTAEPGTLVCGSPGTTLLISERLTVQGSSEKPVRFTAMDSTAPWGGIRGVVVRSSGSSVASATTIFARHATVDHAMVGIAEGRVDIESVTVRATAGPGLSGVAGSLARLTVTDACQAPMANPNDCAAISTMVNGVDWEDVTLREVAVHGSRGGGLRVARGSRATASELSVQSIGGDGITIQGVGPPRTSYARMAAVGPVEVRDAGGYKLWAHGGSFASLLAAMTGTLLPGDRVFSQDGDAQRGHVHVPDGVAWHLSGTQTTSFAGMFGKVVLDPGSSLVGHPFSFADFLALEVSGEADQPVSIEKYRLSSSEWPFAVGAAAADLRHASLRNAHVTVTGVGSSVRGLIGRDASLTLSGAGSVAKGVSLVGSPGHGITVAADSVVIEACVVTGSALDGIHVAAGQGVRVTSCSLESNGGDGVGNDGGFTVAAPGNWWGSAEGPMGRDGDGVRGPVDFTPPLSAPPDGRPTSINVAVRSELMTGDTARVSITAWDDRGLAVPSTRFRLDLSDGRLASPDATDPLLVAGVEQGRAHAEVVYSADPTVRTPLELTVVEGAGFLNWEVTDLGWTPTKRVTAILPFSEEAFAIVGTEGSKSTIAVWEGGRQTALPSPAWLLEGSQTGIRIGGARPNELWAAFLLGDDSAAVVSRWTGGEWVGADTVPGSVTGLWVRQEDEVFVSGSRGILGWTGTGWTPLWSAQPAKSCEGLVVASSTDAFTICSSYALWEVVRFDGASWSSMLGPTPANPYRPTSLFVGGDGYVRLKFGGYHLLWDGSAWSTQASDDGCWAFGGTIYGAVVPWRSGTLEAVVVPGTPVRGLWYWGPGERCGQVWSGGETPGSAVARFGETLFLAVPRGVAKGRLR